MRREVSRYLKPSEDGQIWLYVFPFQSKLSQARILEWAGIPFSRRTSQPRGQTWVSCTAGRFLTIWATRKTLNLGYRLLKLNRTLDITYYLTLILGTWRSEALSSYRDRLDPGTWDLMLGHFHLNKYLQQQNTKKLNNCMCIGGITLWTKRQNTQLLL